MVLKVPTFKIRGSRPPRGAARPDIFILPDEGTVSLRREATSTLDPLESSFTIPEAHELSAALLELLKVHAESATQRAQEVDGEDEEDGDGEEVSRPEKPPARIAVALAP